MIYGRAPAYPFCRLAVQVAGKRVLRSFATFGAAKKAAKVKLRNLAKGNQAAALSAKEAADALATRQALRLPRKKERNKALIML